MYVDGEMSIPEISKLSGIPQSSVRCALKKKGVLRSRADAIRIAAKKGKLGSGLRGKKRPLTEEWKLKISKSKLILGEKTAKGVSKKPSGYIEYTRGEHKGRSVHVVAMEQKIGRRIFAYEVVHHIDHNKENNEICNLMLCTKSQHSRIHALENHPFRKRNKNGQFK